MEILHLSSPVSLFSDYKFSRILHHYPLVLYRKPYLQKVQYLTQEELFLSSLQTVWFQSIFLSNWYQGPVPGEVVARIWNWVLTSIYILLHAFSQCGPCYCMQENTQEPNFLNDADILSHHKSRYVATKHCRLYCEIWQQPWFWILVCVVAGNMPFPVHSIYLDMASNWQKKNSIILNIHISDETHLSVTILVIINVLSLLSEYENKP